ncbi:PepSY domain-containing protein [Erythrobacter sp.]|uniref:PepSY-associated TM helix domain-containing protein n=1 Tax=Erythrobacter sp. TaxID=1042 RepID=UPI0025FB79B0|nr:PepSY-associated TM helix domain-containing protein [Erythrobacter sp.]
MDMVRDLDAAGHAHPAKKRKASRIWWTVHQWVGIKLSLFMAFVMFTGTLAVVSNEIDWVLQPSLRVAPASVQGPVEWAAIAENAARHPGVGVVRSMEAPVASAFAVKVTVEDAAGDLFYLHAHPATGTIQGEGPWAGAQRILRNMHRHLNLPTKIGVPIVAFLGFLLLVSLVTSLVVYKKWWRGFTKPLRNRDARTWWGDFHRLAGVWSLWFVTLMALTGMWYFVESLGLAAPPPPRVKIEAPTEPGWQGIETAFAAAMTAYPELEVRRVLLPGKESPVLQLHGDHEAVLVRPRANTVWVDPVSAKVLLTTDGRDMNVHQRIGEMADPLHFGDFGGYWTKVPWFLFGLLLTGLSLSGAAIYSLRIVRERGGHARLAQAFAGVWRDQPRWRWVSAGLIAVGFALLPALIWQLS